LAAVGGCFDDYVEIEEVSGCAYLVPQQVDNVVLTTKVFAVMDM